jgi:RHS repeat-associated protein
MIGRYPSVRRRLTGATIASAFLIQTACSGPPVDEMWQEERGGPGPSQPNQPPLRPLPELPRDVIRRPTAPIALPGEGGVNDFGAAIYSLPLAVPAGPNGMQPALSIEYASTGGSGPLGVGMSLGGLSAIAPCPKTFASEGFAAGVRYVESDSYCLDGQKLVRVEDPDYVPAAGDQTRTYRTEADSQQRVVAHHTSLSDQPLSFTVHQTDGTTRTYTARYAPVHTGVDARESHYDPADQIAFVYVLTLVEDVNKNRVRYLYDNEPGTAADESSLRLERIDYSIGTDEVVHRRIDLRYESRPDPMIRYARGVKLVMRTRLSEIEMAAPNPTTTAPVWRYELAYKKSGDTGRSLLDTVQMCEQHDECSWVRSFAWSQVKGTDSETNYDEEKITTTREFDDPEMGFHLPDWWDYFAAVQWAIDNGERAPDWIRSSDTRIMLFDVDGDGDDDALYRAKPTRLAAWSSWLSTSDLLPKRRYEADPGSIRLRRSGAYSPDQWNYVPLTESFEDVTSYLEEVFTHPSEMLTDEEDDQYLGDRDSWVTLGKSRLVDTDGNGVLELQLARTIVELTQHVLSGTYYKMDEWRHGITTMPEYPWAVGDLPEALETTWIFGPYWSFDWDLERYTARVASPPFQRVIADLDGDGRSEAVDSVEGVNALQHEEHDWSLPFNAIADEFPYHATISSSGDEVEFDQPWQCNNGQARVTDTTGDGRDDVLVADEDVTPAESTEPGLYRALGLATANAFSGNQHGDPEVTDTSELWAGDCGYHDPDLTMGDWNGDGLEDVLYPTGSYDDNGVPFVRWNLGNGYGPIQPMPVEGSDPATLTALMEQETPLGTYGNGIPWDRGTRVADVDADGRADIIAFRQDNADCFQDAVDEIEVATVPVSDFVCDVKVVLYLSRGDHFEGQVIRKWADAGATVAEGFTTHQIGDVDGDGAVDLVAVVDGTIQTTLLPWRKVPDRLELVKDGGVATYLEAFQYTRQWWGDAPRATAQGDCQYPVSCTYRGFPVVRKHTVHAGTKTDGTAKYRSDIHRYQGAKWNMRGRGFLGFAEHRIWDRERGAETIRYFDNAVSYDSNGAAFYGGEHHPYVGMPMQTITVEPLTAMPTDAQLATSHAAPGLSDLTPVPVRVTITATTDIELRASGEDDRVVTVLPVETVETTYEHLAVPVLSSATATHSPTPTYDPLSYLLVPPSVPKIERTSTSEYDSRGFLKKEIVTTTGGVVETTSTTYEHRPGPWLLGMPTRVAGTSQAAGVDGPTRVGRALYDAKGRVMHVRRNAIQPNVCPVVTAEGCEQHLAQYDFTYDAFGNTDTIKATASDAATPRLVRTEYDVEGVYPKRYTDALGFTAASLHHPALGVIVVEEDAQGILTTATYDGFGRALSSSAPGTATVTNVITPFSSGTRRGIRTDTTSQDGAVSYRLTDEVGQEIEAGVIDYQGNWRHADRTYDPLGNVVGERSPSLSPYGGKLTTTTRDRMGNALAVKDANNATTTYERSLFETVTRDPAEHETFVAFDVDGRAIRSGHRLYGWVGLTYYSGQEYGAIEHAYGPFDQLAWTTDAEGNVALHAHDPFGRPASFLDPDTGLTTYHYDGFGDLRLETDANGWTTTWEYDALGRPLAASRADGTTTWQYGTTGTSARRLVSTTSGDGVLTQYGYDSLGREANVTQTVGGVADRIDRRYDAYGRPLVVFYPAVSGMARFKTQMAYDTHGYALSISDASGCNHAITENGFFDSGCSPTPIWTATARDERSAVTAATLGTNWTELRDYDDVDGQLRTLQLKQGATLSASYSYDYDADGLLEQRTDHKAFRTEHFEHDPLHRLTEWELLLTENKEPFAITHSAKTTYRYDPLGNLEQVIKNGVEQFAGTYGDSGRPHVLDKSTTPSGSTSYFYDTAGHQTVAGARTTDWTRGHQPRRIVDATGAADFLYGSQNERVRKTTAAETTTYFHGLYERHLAGGATSHRFFVFGESGVVAQMTYASADATMRYFVNDPLGSATHVLRTSSIEESAYFAPFGARVDAQGNAVADPNPTTSQGFTGHESDGGTLVNMQGRIYDYAQYRFLSPDPLVNEPLLGQSHNPYSYVLNSPLLYVDPSGFSAEAVSDPPGTETTPDAPTVISDPGPPPPTGPVSSPLTQTTDAGGAAVGTAQGTTQLVQSKSIDDLVNEVETGGDEGYTYEESEPYDLMEDWVNSDQFQGLQPNPAFDRFMSFAVPMAITTLVPWTRFVFGAYDLYQAYKHKSWEMAGGAMLGMAGPRMGKGMMNGLGGIKLPGGGPKYRMIRPATVPGRDGTKILGRLPDPDGGGPHVADYRISRGGKTLREGTLRSGVKNAEEEAMGFPLGNLASHTERRLMRLPFKEGDVVELWGSRPPCPACKGAMNRAAREKGAKITYRWTTPEGRSMVWEPKLKVKK